jgi:hypothetical protein
MPGARGEFDRSLEAIEAKVIELFAMITDDLPRAAHALQGAGEAARVLAGRERVIDALYLEVERLASREVLLQAPVAAGLRFLLSVLRVTPELERSHDLVMQVADRAGLAAPLAGTSRPAPATSPPVWETSPARYGARQPTPGTSATAAQRRPWPGASGSWTSCTPPWRPNSPLAR